jgi:hypothetical protein
VKEIPRHLWNSNFKPCLQNTATWPYPVYTLTSHFLRIQLNSILPSSPMYPNGLFPLDVLTQILYAFLISHMHALCFSHVILIDFIALIICGEEYNLWSYSLFSVFLSSCYFLFLRSEYSSSDLVLRHLQSVLNNCCIHIIFYLFTWVDH